VKGVVAMVWVGVEVGVVGGDGGGGGMVGVVGGGRVAVAMAMAMAMAMAVVVIYISNQESFHGSSGDDALHKPWEREW